MFNADLKGFKNLLGLVAGNLHPLYLPFNKPHLFRTQPVFDIQVEVDYKPKALPLGCPDSYRECCHSAQYPQAVGIGLSR